jgi:hypothetical protein
MRIRLGLLAACAAFVLPIGAGAPAASADGVCRSGYSLYDTGVPGGFKEDRNLNGLVCWRAKATTDGYRSWYTDDR